MSDKLVYIIVNGIGEEVGEITLPYQEDNSHEIERLKNENEYLKKRLRMVERALSE